MANEDFINLMLEKSKEKYKEPEPHKQLEPEKEPERNEKTGLSEEDVKSVEQFTKELRERMQK